MKHSGYSRHSGFYMLYAVLFIVSIGLACVFYLQQHYHKSFALSQVYAKTQLQLHARSVKQMALMCLRQKDIAQCDRQEFIFSHYHFYAHLTPLNSGTILLDIHGKVTHPASNNLVRITRRYVLVP